MIARIIPLAVLLAAWPAAAQAQRLGGGGDGPDVSIARVLAAFAVCVAAALALAFVLKRRKTSIGLPASGWFARSMAGSRRIDVIESRRLSQFADICLVRCDDTEYLLLCGAAGQRILHRAPAESRDG